MTELALASLDRECENDGQRTVHRHEPTREVAPSDWSSRPRERYVGQQVG